MEQAPTVEPLIQQCVYERLLLVCNQTFADQSSNLINRPTVCILNSFDPARSKTKPFVGVQELTTLECYSNNWSQLLLFLIRISENQEYSSIRAIVLLNQSQLWMKLDAVISTAKSLQAVNVSGLDYKNCCQTVPSSSLA